MAVDSGVLEQMAEQGMGVVLAEQGLCALELAMIPSWSLPVTAMVPLQWPRMVLQMGSTEVPSLLQDLAAPYAHLVQLQHKPAEVQSMNALTTSLRQLPSSKRVARLQALVLEHVASVGGQLEVGLDEPLMEAGLDSLSAVELVNQLSRSLGDGVRLSATALFDYPTVSRLATHIETLLCWEEDGADTPVVQLAVQQANAVHKSSALVVAGSGCTLPGAGNSSVAFWCVLSSAVDPICGVPSGRWDERRFAETAGQLGGCYVQCGGFVAGLEGFDNRYFRISAAEASQMDPQQRAVLEVSALHCVL